MVAHFIEMGFPAEKVAMALEHAGRGGGDKEADVLQWLLDKQEGSSRQGAAHLTSPMATHFIGMGFSAEDVAMALEHAGGGRNVEAVVLQWLFDHQETDLDGFSSSIDLEGISSSSGDLEVISSPTDLETFHEELTEGEKFFKLVEMGFTSNEASAAITRCAVPPTRLRRSSAATAWSEDQGFHPKQELGEVRWSHGIAHKRESGAHGRRRYQNRHRRSELSLGHNTHLPRVVELAPAPTTKARDTMIATPPPDLDLGEEWPPCQTSPGAPDAVCLAALAAKGHDQHHRHEARRRTTRSRRSGLQTPPNRQDKEAKPHTHRDDPVHHTNCPQLDEKARLGHQIPRSSRPEARATRDDDHQELADDIQDGEEQRDATPAGAPRRRRLPGTPVPPAATARLDPRQKVTLTHSMVASTCGVKLGAVSAREKTEVEEGRVVHG
ncbi:hypothetical protein QYE76_036818 [Lolium multiflorum]|uniref:UBA domain-containing protein n=1 Tax=Lolium multiflorum TaxID=4521 RepID=A0AAD8VQB4_LOLMU|nr:hypothetical protein QYE76_036818 [Lolium multiflorum]